METETVKKLLGKNIKKYRHALKFTQAQLGNKMHINQRQVAYIENGHSFPSIQTLIKFTNVFNCDLKNLFDFGVEGLDNDPKLEIIQELSKIDDKNLNVYYQIFNTLNRHFRFESSK